MKEIVIKIGKAAGVGGDEYPVEASERDGAALNSLGPAGIMRLTTAELSVFKGVLPGNTPPTALEAEGEALYNKLRAGLSQPFEDLLNAAPVRIYLDLPDDLHGAPWELMRWRKPVFGGTVLTSISQAHHLCRVYQPDWNAQPPAPQGPWRMLIAIGKDDESVEANKEVVEILRRVQPAQRTVDIEIISPTDRDDLYAKIREFVPHVLHFIGHGTSDPPELEFEGWSLTAGDVVADVGGDNMDRWKPGLVFLNACRTLDAAGLAAPMAGAFIDKGAQATIAMQGNIQGTAAGILAGEFYEKLAAGTSINEALSMARSVVAGKYTVKEAMYPALTLRCAPPAALPSFHLLGDEYRQRLDSCTLLPVLNYFVNQVKPRRALCSNFWPFRLSDLQRRFVLLRGDAGFGKTILSAWALDLSLRVGHRVRYVKVAPETGAVDYIDILRLIWGEQGPGPRSPLTEPLPPRPELEARLKSSKDTAVYVPFRTALAEVAQERPLTIVLDEFKKSMDSGSFWTLWEHLFVPLAGDEFKRVNLVLVLGEDEYADYKIEEELKARPQFKIPMKDIQLVKMDEEDFIARFNEYLYFRSERFHDEDLKGLIEMTAKSVAKNDPRPLSVARFEEKARQMSQMLGFEI
jgi:hypothetical protein